MGCYKLNLIVMPIAVAFPYVVSLREKIHIACDTWYIVIDLDDFFSIQFLRTTRSGCFYLEGLVVYFQSCTGAMTIYCSLSYYAGFPGSPAGKESACNAGDPGSIPGRSPGEEKGYPLQYSGLENSVDCSPPGSSVPGILQARILEWAAIPFSWGSS